MSESPRIHSPRLVRALNAGARVYGALTKNLRQHLPTSQDQELKNLVWGELQHTHQDLEGVHVLDLKLDLRLAFGKPTLISADLLVDVQPVDTEKITSEQQSPQQFFLMDLLSQLVEKLWDNPFIAPVAIRARLVQAANETELADLRVLGYPDEIARPEDLYANFGSPAADPKWRP